MVKSKAHTSAKSCGRNPLILRRGGSQTHVLDKIKQLIDDTPKDFAEPNFRLCFKINQLQNGKPQAYYELTKDGFTLLAMGFTGKKTLFGVSFLF